MRLNYRIVAWLLLLLTAAALGIRHLREPDIWWMLRTGQWMVENGRVVSQDVFSFTFQGVEWINVKWFFEVVIFFISKISGPECIHILQGLVNVLLLTYLLKIVHRLKSKIDGGQSSISVGLIIAGFMLLFACEFRMIGRPEMTSHLMTILFLFHYISFRFSPSRKIYWIIPLQIFWVNSHEAFAIGMVISLVFLMAEIVEYYYLKRDKSRGIIFPKHLVRASVLSILAVSINPNGIKMLAHPFEIFSQVGENKFTLELFSFTTDYYWQQKESFLMILVLVLTLTSLVITAYKKTKKKNWLNNFIESFGLGYIAMVILFFYLALSAHRNIPFFILCSSPIVAVTLDNVINVFRKQFKLNYETIRKATYVILIICGIGFYMSIITNVYYKQFNEREKYGLAVFPIKNPVGASSFIKENNIGGQCFSDYLSSSYLLWDLRPEFKSFIDLRDLDIFPSEFFQEFARTMAFPREFLKLDSTYNFNYAVLYRPRFAGLHRFLFKSRDWSLVYADPVAVVFLKNNESNTSIIDVSGLNDENEDIFQRPQPINPSSFAGFVSKIFNPFYDFVEDVYDYDLIAASYYKQIGQYNLAVKRAKQSASNNIDNYLRYEMLGNIYIEIGDQSDSIKIRTDYYKIAQSAFAKGIDLAKNRFGCYKGLALTQMRIQKFEVALNYLERSLKIEENDRDLFIMLAQCHSGLIPKNPQYEKYHLDKWLEYMERAYSLNKEDIKIQFHLGVTYCRINNCEMVEKHLKDNYGYPGISDQELATLKKCKNTCGIN